MHQRPVKVKRKNDILSSEILAHFVQFYYAALAMLLFYLVVFARLSGYVQCWKMEIYVLYNGSNFWCVFTLD